MMYYAYVITNFISNVNYLSLTFGQEFGQIVKKKGNLYTKV